MFRTAFLGALAGGVSAAAVWMIASRLLDKQLQQGATQLSFGLQQGRGALEARIQQGRDLLEGQIRSAVQAQVPPVVRAELESTLRRYNITPETGQNISTILSYGNALGLYGLGYH